jgi:ABC-type glycerol-3-phosphate transport system substrate-binding protein
MKRNGQSILAMATMTVLLAAAMAACGTADKAGREDAPVTPPQPKKADDPVTLKVATWVPKENDGFQAIPKAFSKKFPNVSVEWIFVSNGPGGVYNVLTESIAAGDPIDVFWHNNFPDTVTKDFAEDLTPWTTKDAEFKKYGFLPGHLETFQWKGKQYALSRGNDVFVVFYNKELLNKYGLDAPKDNWTWEELKAMAKKATNPAEKHYGISNHSSWFQFGATVLPYVNGHADRINMLSADMTRSVADQPKVLDDLAWMQDWIKKDGIMLNPKRSKEVGVAEAQGATWTNGQSLFHLHVSPSIAGFKTSLKFAWDVAPMPAGTKTQASLSFNNPMFVSKASKHKEEAWEFVKFWAATAEGQKLLIDAGGTFPNTDDPEIVNYFKTNKLYEGLNTAALVYSSAKAVIDPTIVGLGGTINSGVFVPWATVNGFANEESPFDYFPPRVEKLNKDLQELAGKIK